MQRHLILYIATLLGAFIGAMIGGFTSFFAVLSLHQSGLLDMKELSVWPDYLFLTFGVLLGGAFVGTIIWRNIQKD